MAAPPQPSKLPAATGAKQGPSSAAAQQHKTTVVVYERNLDREIRVLEAKITRLEEQLTKEMEKIQSCTSLLQEIMGSPRDSACSKLREELDKARAKRERAYQKFLSKQQQEMEMKMEMEMEGAVDGEAAGASK